MIQKHTPITCAMCGAPCVSAEDSAKIDAYPKLVEVLKAINRKATGAFINIDYTISVCPEWLVDTCRNVLEEVEEIEEEDE